MNTKKKQKDTEEFLNEEKENNNKESEEFLDDEFEDEKLSGD